LRDTLRQLAVLGAAKLVSPPLLVLNRLGAPGTLDRKQVLAALQRAPDIIIPFLPKLMHSATTLGEPAVRKRGPLQNAIAVLAHEIFPTPAAEAVQRGGGAGGLLKRFRK
jgi:pilus assembly protein CpaE